MLKATLSGYFVDAEKTSVTSLPSFYATRTPIESDFRTGGQIARKLRVYIRLLNDVCSLAYNCTICIQKPPIEDKTHDVIQIR